MLCYGMVYWKSKTDRGLVSIARDAECGIGGKTQSRKENNPRWEELYQILSNQRANHLFHRKGRGRAMEGGELGRGILKNHISGFLIIS